eukprot:SAG22_NODE_639_length_8255_cov_13.659882_3_plen_96_part_00
MLPVLAVSLWGCLTGATADAESAGGRPHIIMVLTDGGSASGAACACAARLGCLRRAGRCGPPHSDPTPPTSPPPPGPAASPPPRAHGQEQSRPSH